MAPMLDGDSPWPCVMRRETNGSRFVIRGSGSAPCSSRAATTSGILRCTAACRAARPAPSWSGSAPRASRKRASSGWPLSMATSRAAASVSGTKRDRALVLPPMPSGADSFTSAPAESSRSAASRLPCWAAKSSGVNRFVERAETAAPVSRSRRATGVWFPATASMSAVWPRVASRALGSAPAARRLRTTSRPPTRAAVISGVSPLPRAALGSAPAASRASTTRRLPFTQASDSGVTPWSSRAFTSAPAASRSVTMACASRCAAQWRAVVPSP